MTEIHLEIYKYTLRIFDPANNWQKVRNDLTLSGSSYQGFTAFLLLMGIYMLMKIMNPALLEDIIYQMVHLKKNGFLMNLSKVFIHGAMIGKMILCMLHVFRSGFTPTIFKFAGKYKDASGNCLSPSIGPAAKWNSINYSIDANGATGTYTAYLEGLNKTNGNWDLLQSNLQNNFDLTNVDAKNYNYIRAKFNFVDSTYGSSNPIQLKSLNVSYQNPTEIVLSKNNFTFSPDTNLQGLPIESSLKIRNIGDINVPSLKVKYYLNASDTSIFRFMHILIIMFLFLRIVLLL